jgi:hypothetical protein
VVGVNVAVIVDVPAPATVAVLPLKDSTDGVEDEYVKVPGVLGVGAVRENVESP